MQVHVLQHVPFEGPGNMLPWFQARGASITTTPFFQGATALPDPTHDLLVVMGGPMSVNDEAQLGWLRSEKDYIARCVDGNRRVLGVCLGAQLIASALGARVFPNAHAEIGWLEVTGMGAGTPFEVDTEYRVFQWHGETFDLPTGSTLIARSSACEHQGFRMGRTWALQFHLEMTASTVRGLVEHCRKELVDAPYIQSEEELLNAPAQYYRDSQALMGALLEQVLDA